MYDKLEGQLGSAEDATEDVEPEIEKEDETEEISDVEAEKEPKVDEYVEKGVEEALQTVKDRFENIDDPEMQLEFHNSSHTEDVIRRTDLVLEAIQKADPSLVDDKTRQLGKLSAGFHDTVQEFEKDEKDDGVVMRKRFASQNEKDSGQEAVEFMKKTNEEAEQDVFSEDDMQTVAESIDATVPGFDSETNTIIQPNLDEESAIIARALALADLGTAGMDGPENFLVEGDALFREENMDVTDAIRNSKDLSDEDKNQMRRRMLNWTVFQSSFTQGRQVLLGKELEGLPPKAQEGVGALFDKFDQTMTACKERMEGRKDMSFEELALDMGLNSAKLDDDLSSEKEKEILKKIEAV